MSQTKVFDSREEYLFNLDETMLKGSVILSEWSSLVIFEADRAFVSEANLATILTAVAAIETHLRFEAAGFRKKNLAWLIDNSNLKKPIVDALHELRRYRNAWVHGDRSDEEEPDFGEGGQEDELEEMAFEAIRLLREVIYSEQWV